MGVCTAKNNAASEQLKLSSVTISINVPIFSLFRISRDLDPKRTRKRDKV